MGASELNFVWMKASTLAKSVRELNTAKALSLAVTVLFWGVVAADFSTMHLLGGIVADPGDARKREICIYDKVGYSLG